MDDDLKRRLVLFVKEFCVRTEDSLSLREEEIDPKGKGKTGTVSKVLGHVAKFKITAPAVVPIKIVTDEVSKGTHRDESTDILNFMNKVPRDKLHRILIQTGAAIFCSYEEQFQFHVDYDDNSVKTMAQDASDRLFSFVKDDNDKVIPSKTYFIKAVMKGNQKNYYSYTVNNENKTKATSIWEKVGVYDRTKGLYYTPYETRPEKYGYRLLFDKEDIDLGLKGCPDRSTSYIYTLTNDLIIQAIAEVNEQIIKNNPLEGIDICRNRINSIQKEVSQTNANIKAASESNSYMHEEVIDNLYKIQGEQQLSHQREVQQTNAITSNIEALKEEVMKIHGTVPELKPIREQPCNSQADVLGGNVNYFRLYKSSHNFFTGRVEKLCELYEKIKEIRTEKRSYQGIAVTGCPGAGKSQLIRRLLDEHLTDENVLWINAESTRSIADSFQDAYEALFLYEVTLDDLNIARLANKIYSRLLQHRTTVVFDSAVDWETLQPFLPQTCLKIQRPHTPLLLFTCRNINCAVFNIEKQYVLSLSFFTEEDFLSYFHKIFNIEGYSDEPFKKLYKSLNGLPLAVSQAAALVKQTALDPYDFDSVVEAVVDVAESLQDLTLHKSDPLCSFDINEKPLYRIWELIIKDIESKGETGKSAIQILEMMAMCAPENIPVRLFTTKVNGSFGNVLKLLKQHSVECNYQTGCMHSLTQDIIRSLMKDRNRYEDAISRLLEIRFDPRMHLTHLYSFWDVLLTSDDLFHKYTTMVYFQDHLMWHFIEYLIQRNDPKVVDKLEWFLKPLNIDGKMLYESVYKGSPDVTRFLNSDDAELVLAAEIVALLKHQNVDQFKEILKHFKSPTYQTISKPILRSPVHVAVLCQSEVIIKALSYRGYNVNDTALQCGCTPLHLAVLTGNELIVKVLMSLNADLNKKNKMGLTPLDLAVLYNKLPMVRQLMDAGAAITKINFLNMSDSGEESFMVNYRDCLPKHECLKVKDHDTIFKFENERIHQTQFELRPFTFDTPMQSRKDVYGLLYEKQIDETLQDFNAGSLVHFAVAIDDIELLKFLHYRQMNINAQNSLGHTSLHIAALSNSIKCCEFLVQCKVDVNAQDRDLNTPLHLACRANREAICRLLLVAGTSNVQEFKWNATNSSGAKPIDEVSDLAVLRCLVGHIASSGSIEYTERILPPPFKQIKVWSKSEMDFIEFLKVLISSGVINIAAKDSQGQTLLHIALDERYRKACYLLIDIIMLKVKSDVINYRIDGSFSRSAKTAYRLITHRRPRRKPHKLHCLSNKNFAIDIIETSSDSSDEERYRISECKSRTIVETYDTEVITKHSYGSGNPSLLATRKKKQLDSSIVQSVKTGNLEVCQALLKQDPNLINTKSAKGDTLLHLAVVSQKEELCELLLKHKADVNAENEEGLTALQWAMLMGGRNIHTFLKRNGANSSRISKNLNHSYKVLSDDQNFKLFRYCTWLFLYDGRVSLQFFESLNCCFEKLGCPNEFILHNMYTNSIRKLYTYSPRRVEKISQSKSENNFKDIDKEKYMADESCWPFRLFRQNKAPFIGRYDELAFLAERADHIKTKKVLVPAIAIAGSPGSGKSELIRKFLGECLTHANVLWINAQNIESISESFNHAHEISLNSKFLYKDGILEERYMAELIGTVYATLPRLFTIIVFDNAVDWHVIKNYFPAPDYFTEHGMLVLLTYSTGNCIGNEIPEEYVLKLKVFSQDDCEKYLKLVLDMNDYSGDVFKNLGTAINGLPLALSAAGAWVKQNTEDLVINTVSELIKTIEKLSLEVDSDKLNIPDPIVKPLYLIWRLILKDIESKGEIGKIALELIAMMAMCAPENIPLYMFSSIDDSQFDETKKLMREYSVFGGAEIACMHSLTQNIIRLLIDNQKGKVIYENTIRRLMSIELDPWINLSHLHSIWKFLLESDTLMNEYLTVDYFEEDLILHFLYYIQQRNDINAVNKYSILKSLNISEKVLLDSVYKGLPNLTRLVKETDSELVFAAEIFAYLEHKNRIELKAASDKFLQSLKDQDHENCFIKESILRSPAHLSVMCLQDIISDFHKNGYDVNKITLKCGCTPLHLAVLTRREYMVESLLKLGADINQPNGIGLTPLDLAILYNKYNIVEQLLNAGASIKKLTFFNKNQSHEDDSITDYKNLLIKATCAGSEAHDTIYFWEDRGICETRLEMDPYKNKESRIKVYELLYSRAKWIFQESDGITLCNFASAIDDKELLQFQREIYQSPSNAAQNSCLEQKAKVEEQTLENVDDEWCDESDYSDYWDYSEADDD